MFKGLRTLQLGMTAALTAGLASEVFNFSQAPKRKRQPEPINYGLRQEIAEHNAKGEAAKREKLKAKLERRAARLK